MSQPFNEVFTTLPALVVKICVKVEYREQFLEQMLADAIGSEKNEPGCLMFNVAQDSADPQRSLPVRGVPRRQGPGGQ